MLRRRPIELLHEHGRTARPRDPEVSALLNAALIDANLRTAEQPALTRNVQQLLEVAAR